MKSKYKFRLQILSLAYAGSSIFQHFVNINEPRFDDCG